MCRDSGLESLNNFLFEFKKTSIFWCPIVRIYRRVLRWQRISKYLKYQDIEKTLNSSTFGLYFHQRIAKNPVSICAVYADNDFKLRDRQKKWSWFKF